jgi:hypothetical protein
MLMMHIVDIPEPMPSESSNRSGSSADSDVTPGGYSTNVSTLTERIAIRLASQGAEHAVAAAITIALRGQSRLDRAGFAAELGIAAADLRALEAGTVAFVDLPVAVAERMHAAGLEPLLLVDLDHQLRGT